VVLPLRLSTRCRCYRYLFTFSHKYTCNAAFLFVFVYFFTYLFLSSCLSISFFFLRPTPTHSIPSCDCTRTCISFHCSSSLFPHFANISTRAGTESTSSRGQKNKQEKWTLGKLQSSQSEECGVTRCEAARSCSQFYVSSCRLLSTFPSRASMKEGDRPRQR